jgi:hypothetical protein
MRSMMLLLLMVLQVQGSEIVTVKDLVFQRWPGISEQQAEPILGLLERTWQQVRSEMEPEHFQHLCRLQIAAWGDHRASDLEHSRERFGTKEAAEQMAQFFRSYPGVDQLTRIVVTKEMEAHRLTMQAIRSWLAEADVIRMPADARFGPARIHTAIQQLNDDASGWWTAEDGHEQIAVSDWDLLVRLIQASQQIVLERFDRKYSVFYHTQALSPKDAEWRMELYAPLGEHMPERAEQLQTVFDEIPGAFINTLNLLSYYVRPKAYLLGMQLNLEDVQTVIQPEHKPDTRYLLIHPDGRVESEETEP